MAMFYLRLLMTHRLLVYFGFLLFYELVECDTDKGKVRTATGVPNAINNPVEPASHRESSLEDKKQLVLEHNDEPVISPLRNESKPLKRIYDGSGEEEWVLNSSMELSKLTTQSTVPQVEHFSSALNVLFSSTARTPLNDVSSTMNLHSSTGASSVSVDVIMRGHSVSRHQLAGDHEKVSTTSQDGGVDIQNIQYAIEDITSSTGFEAQDLNLVNSDHAVSLDEDVSTSGLSEDVSEDLKEPSEVLYTNTEKSAEGEAVTFKELSEDAHVLHGSTAQRSEYMVSQSTVSHVEVGGTTFILNGTSTEGAQPTELVSHEKLAVHSALGNVLSRSELPLMTSIYADNVLQHTVEGNQSQMVNSSSQILRKNSVSLNGITEMSEGGLVEEHQGHGQFVDHWPKTSSTFILSSVMMNSNTKDHMSYSAATTSLNGLSMTTELPVVILSSMLKSSLQFTRTTSQFLPLSSFMRHSSVQFSELVTAPGYDEHFEKSRSAETPVQSSLLIRATPSFYTPFMATSSVTIQDSHGSQIPNNILLKQQSDDDSTRLSVEEEQIVTADDDLHLEPTKSTTIKDEEQLLRDGQVEIPVQVDHSHNSLSKELAFRVDDDDGDDETKSEYNPMKEESEHKYLPAGNATSKLHSSFTEEVIATRTYQRNQTEGTPAGSHMLYSSMDNSLHSAVAKETAKFPITDIFNGTATFQVGPHDKSTTTDSYDTSNHTKAFIPVRPTKVPIIPDRRTKYNRLPAEHSADDKPDHNTDSNAWKPDPVLPTIRVPVAYLSVTMKCTWTYFCMQRLELQRVFAQQLMRAIKMRVEEWQVVFFNVHMCRNTVFHKNMSTVDAMKMAITVPLYMADKWGVYSKSLTELLGMLIVHNRIQGVNADNITLPSVVLAVQLHHKEETVIIQQQANHSDGDMGIIAAVTISCIAGVCLVLLGILLLILKRRHGLKERMGRCRPATDAYSLESVSSVHSSFRRRKIRGSKRSHLNLAFDDPCAPSNKLNFAGLANACINEETLAEEYKQIPMHMAKYDELPPGADIKNRYANIIPFPETRVILASKAGKNESDYINANYVRGYRGEPKRYIACQAPLEDTVIDFWHMVWENQCKVIIMLTAIEEDGVNKCSPYFSETEALDCHRLYGDYQVTTKKRDIQESFVVSTLQIKYLEKNLMRDVIHFWYTGWPNHHVPSDHISITELLVETRRYTKSSTGPMVVHCSPGTGRTGCVLAIDIGMHEFENTRVVDIPQCVHLLRQDRGGCVQTAEQYIFIYEVLGEYASRLINYSGKSSVRSTK